MEFPQPEPDDNDDVAWAIQTANTMYKRGDHAEAIRWLQRAADAAEEAGDDRRLLVLARAAAEFAAPRPNASAPAPAAKPSSPPPAVRTSGAPAQPKPSAPPPAMPAPQRPASAFKRSAPVAGRSAPPPHHRSAPPPRRPPAEPITELAADEVTPVSAAPSAPPPPPATTVEATPKPADVTPSPQLDRMSATATPTTKLDAAARRRLEGLSAGSTPTTPAVPQRRARPSETGEEVTHVFRDPQSENAKSKPRASAAPLAPSAATRSPLPLRRPFMSSATGIGARERAQSESHGIHDSAPQPHRALRVCVLRATSPGTFLVRPLSPGEPLPPNGREALLVPIDPDDDFSH